MHETILAVPSMTCNNCINRIKRAVNALNGVHSIQTNLATASVRIRHESHLDGEQLAACISAAGYPAQIAEHGDVD